MPVMNVNILKATEALQGFWSWWSDEMIGMVPASLRGEPTDRDRFDIFLHAGQTVIETVLHGEAQRMLESSNFGDLRQDSWDQIEQFSKNAKPRLFLGAGDILRIPVTMPRASAGQLYSAITLQLPTLVPIVPEQIDWGFADLERDEHNISLLLFIARSSRLDALEELFSNQNLMPPSFCANIDDKIVTLRKPLELARQPLEHRKMMAAMVIVAMLIMIPLSTIGGAELLAWLNIDRAQRLERDLRVRLENERKIQQEENIRQAAAPLLNIPSASNMLEALAQNLPASDWVVSSAQTADGNFEFVADMADRDAAETALRKARNIGKFRIVEEINTENLRARVHYRIVR